MGMLFTTVRSPNRFVMPCTFNDKSDAVMEKLIFADEKLNANDALIATDAKTNDHHKSHNSGILQPSLMLSGFSIGSLGIILGTTATERPSWL